MLSKRDEDNEKRDDSVVPYQTDATHPRFWLRCSDDARERWRKQREEAERHRRQLRDFSEAVGWSEDELLEIADDISEMPTMLKGHYRGELRAIVKDLAHEIGIELKSRSQEIAILCMFLSDDDDDDSDEEWEPEPEGEDELEPVR